MFLFDRVSEKLPKDINCYPLYGFKPKPKALHKLESEQNAITELNEFKVLFELFLVIAYMHEKKNFKLF